MSLEIGLVHRVLERVPTGTPGPDAAGAITAQALDDFLTERAHSAKPTVADAFPPTPARETVRTADAPSLVLTFDDAFADFESHALPVLERHGVSCLLFAVTDWAFGRGRPFEYALESVLTAGNSLPLYDGLRRAWKPLPASEREARIQELAVALAVDEAAAELRPPLLTADDLARLDRHPLVTIGSHTVTHGHLPSRRGIEVTDELVSSRDELSRLLGRTVDHFAYPYGAHDRGVRRRVRAAGYRVAFGTTPGAVTNRSRPTSLPRNDLATVVSRVVSATAGAR